jgi:hypothetical protein
LPEAESSQTGLRTWEKQKTRLHNGFSGDVSERRIEIGHAQHIGRSWVPLGLSVFFSSVTLVLAFLGPAGLLKELDVVA